MTSENYQRLRSLCQRLADALRRRRLTPEEKDLLTEADTVLTTGRGKPKARTWEEIETALNANDGSVAKAAESLGIARDTIYKAKRRQNKHRTGHRPR